MKKNILLSLAAIAALMVSCKEKEDPTPSVKGSITAETVEYTVPTEGTDEAAIEVKFTSTVDWTAAFESEIDWATIKPKSGAAGEAVVKVTADAYDEANSSRTAVLVITGGDAEPLKVTLTQNGEFEPYFSVDNAELSVGVDGGIVSFTIDTNVEFDTTTYEQFQTWAPFSLDGTTGTFTVAASKEYAPRTAYVKFTIPSIQVTNDEGETVAETVRVYVSQEGALATAWSFDYDETLVAATSVTTALAGEYFLVSTGNEVIAYNKATGEKVTTLELPLTPKGITNDDAGNIVFFTGGEYGDDASNLQVFYLPADKLTDTSAAKQIVNYANGFCGYGIDNLRVTGDVSKDAAITTISAGAPSYGGASYVIVFEIKGGEVVSNYADCVTVTYASDIWNSRNAVGHALGTTVADGVYFIGYDGNYNLHYNATMLGGAWEEVFVTGTDSNYGYNTLDMIEWNGHKYLYLVAMSYASGWGGAGTSYLKLLNIDNVAAPELVASVSIDATDGVTYPGNLNSDVVLAVEDGNLAAYLIDGGTAKVGKLVYPAI